MNPRPDTPEGDMSPPEVVEQLVAYVQRVREQFPPEVVEQLLAQAHADPQVSADPQSVALLKWIPKAYGELPPEGAEPSALPVPGEDTTQEAEQFILNGTLHQLIEASLQDMSKDELALVDALVRLGQGIANEAPDEVHRAFVMLRKIIGKQKRGRGKRSPDAPNAFDAQGLAKVPSASLVQLIVNGYSNAHEGGSRWRKHPDEQAWIYEQVFGDRGRAVFQVRPTEDDANPTATFNSLVQLLNKGALLGDLDADVFLAMLAQSLLAPEPDGTTWITLRRILEYRGILRKMNGEGRRTADQTEYVRQIAACVARQRYQWVWTDLKILEAVGDPAGGKKRKVKSVPPRARSTRKPLTIIEEERWQHELMPMQAERPTEGSSEAQYAVKTSEPVAWRYRFGGWIDAYLQWPNRQIAYLAQSSLSYDPYREAWEKRLSRYFMFHLRMNVHKGDGRSARVGVGTLIDTLSLPVDTRHPQRTRARFERAMHQLVEDGHIQRWEYADQPRLDSRGWLESWKACIVQIEITPEIRARHRRDAGEEDETSQTGGLSGAPSHTQARHTKRNSRKTESSSTQKHSQRAGRPAS